MLNADIVDLSSVDENDCTYFLEEVLDEKQLSEATKASEILSVPADEKSKTVVDPDEELLEDESLLERLYGLTEMFPEALRSACYDFTCAFYKKTLRLSSLSRKALWTISSSFVVMILPVLFEHELSSLAEQHSQQMRQIMPLNTKKKAKIEKQKKTSSENSTEENDEKLLSIEREDESEDSCVPEMNEEDEVDEDDSTAMDVENTTYKRSVRLVKNLASEKLKRIKKAKQKTIENKTVCEKLLKSVKSKPVNVCKTVKARKSPEFLQLKVSTLKMWEKLRRSEITKEERQALCKQLSVLVKGNAKQLVSSHATSRVVECLMQYGDQEMKNALFNELKGDVVELMKSKYARFFVLKALRYGSKEQKSFIIGSLSGNMLKLMRDANAVKILNTLFIDFLNQKQQALLIQELYDSRFAIFKDETVRSLTDALAKMPSKKAQILEHFRKTIWICASKSSVMYYVTHQPFYDYISAVDGQERQDFIDLLKEHLAHLVHTKFGSKTAISCIWYANKKMHKKFVYGFKTFATKVALDKYGYLVLLALLTYVDEVKLLSNIILKELFRDADTLLMSSYAKKIFLFLLVGKKHKHLTPEILNAFCLPEHVDTQFSDEKKNAFSACASHILRFCTENVRLCLLDGALNAILEAVLSKRKEFQNLSEEYHQLLNAIAESLNDEYVPGEENLSENIVTHLFLKNLITSNDHQDFSDRLIHHLNPKVLKSWTLFNRGSFILLSLLEKSASESKSHLVEVLKPVLNQLKRNDSACTKLLCKQICGI